jgi:hypothetical protein
MSTMPFGKFKGKKLNTIPRPYLEWFLSDPVTADIPVWLKIEIEDELTRRSSAAPEPAAAPESVPLTEKDLTSRREMASMGAFSREMQKVLWNKETVLKILEQGTPICNAPDAKEVALALKRVLGWEPFPQTRP